MLFLIPLLLQLQINQHFIFYVNKPNICANWYATSNLNILCPFSYAFKVASLIPRISATVVLVSPASSRSFLILFPTSSFVSFDKFWFSSSNPVGAILLGSFGICKDYLKVHQKGSNPEGVSRLVAFRIRKVRPKVHHDFERFFGRYREKTGFGIAVWSSRSPILPLFCLISRIFALKSIKKELLPW